MVVDISADLLQSLQRLQAAWGTRAFDKQTFEMQLVVNREIPQRYSLLEYEGIELDRASVLPELRPSPWL